MTNLTIALQLYTIRDFTASDLPGTLQQVKAMGYNAVELAGMYGLSAEQLKAELDAAGLTAFSAHVPFTQFESDPKGTVDAYKMLGCKYVGIPILNKTDLPGCENWQYVQGVIATAAALCKEANMPLMYHNHAFEFEKLQNGKYILDEIFGTTGMLAELDTGWITAAGQCPVAYINKYTGRLPIVHLKDTVKTGESYEDRPVGQGSQDMAAILQAAKDAGATGVVVELDRSVGMTSLEAARQSLEYLKDRT